MNPLEKLHEEFQKLSSSDKQAFLAKIVTQTTGQTEILSLKAEINQIYKKHCPHCQSHSIVANGKNKGVQRFRCKECSKKLREEAEKKNVERDAFKEEQAETREKYAALQVENKQYFQVRENTNKADPPKKGFY